MIRRIGMGLTLLSLVLLAVVGGKADAHPGFGQPQYYVVSFSYQDRRNAPVRSHSFATFVRVEHGRITEQVDLSWLPAVGYFRDGYEMPPVRTVPGRNYTLEETLGIAAHVRQPVQRFGPYPISQALFETARQQRRHLESGRVQYKMLDHRTRPGAINCIHAVTDIGGFVATGTMCGAEASRFIIDHFARSGHLRLGATDETVFALIAQRLPFPLATMLR